MDELLNKRFDTRDEIIQAAKKYFLEQGFALTTFKSDLKKNSLYLICDRGGVYRNRMNLEEESASSKTRKIDCPFRLYAKMYAGKDYWTLKVIDSSHNHLPAKKEELITHPSARKLSEACMQSINDMTKAGIKPRNILHALRNSFDHVDGFDKEKETLKKPIKKQIYNAMEKCRASLLHDKDQIKTLIQSYEENGFHYKLKFTPEGEITAIFFMHNDSLNMYKRYDTINIIDCTYKTNAYNFALMQIIGITCNYSIFNIAYTWLTKEDEDSFVWALQAYKSFIHRAPKVVMSDRALAFLNALATVMPDAKHMLCTWHIEKNIYSNCVKKFESVEAYRKLETDWRHCISAPTESEFESKWLEMCQTYISEEEASCISYLERTWLVHKEKFVHAFTNDCMHFDIRTSSWVESAHSKLKKYLEVGNSNLWSVHQKMVQIIRQDVTDHNESVASQKIRWAHKFKANKHLNRLHGKISDFAMEKIFSQIQEVNFDEAEGACTQTFSTIWGIPCKHVLKNIIQLNEELRPNLIHRQWHLEPEALDISPEEPSNLLDFIEKRRSSLDSTQKKVLDCLLMNVINGDIPGLRVPAIPKKKGTRSDTSTKRKKCQFEIVEAEIRNSQSSSKR